MTEIVTAVYEKGILRPLQPLKLRERQTVRIQVLLDDTQALIDDSGVDLDDLGGESEERVTVDTDCV